MTGPMTGDPPEVLRERNQRLIAERTGWPEGALEACRRIETEFPAWSVGWAPENKCPGFECPTGFHARIYRAHWSERREQFAETAEELLRLLSREP